MMVFHGCEYFEPYKSFQISSFKVNNKSMKWHYERYFNCNSKNVI